MDFYVFATEAEADVCLQAINTSGWFPIKGYIDGVPAPEDKAKTLKWAEAPSEMLSGEWAVPRPPKSRLDFLGVSEAEQAAFVAAFGQDIRDLDSSDFPEPEEEV